MPSRSSIEISLALLAVGSFLVPHVEAGLPPGAPGPGDVVWEEDFSGPDLGPWSVSYYAPPGGTKGKPAISVKDGNLLYTTTFLAAPDVRGYASASHHFKNGGAGFKLADAPVLEIRLRPLMDAGHGEEMSLTIVLNYKTYGGDSMWTTVEAWGRTAKAGDWVIVRKNLYDHPTASGPAGKEVLLDINFFLQSEVPGEPSAALEIDWMRLQRMTEEEQTRFSVFDDLLTRFEMQPAPTTEGFFGLGFYGLSCPRWGGSWPATLDRIARDWVNFMGAASGRFYQSVWNDHRSVVPGSEEAELPEGDEGRATVYVKTHQYLAPMLREYGMNYIGSLVGFAGGVEDIALTDRDRNQLNRWADEIAVLRDEPNLLGWFCRDEARPTYLVNFLVTKAMIESRVPDKPAMVLLNSTEFLRVYNDSHQVIFTDRYPILRPTRDDPWKILRWMTEIDAYTGGKPHWFTLEAFRIRKEPWHARPSEIDLRMMSWLSIAGGAKVNCYFLLSGGPWWEDYYIRKKKRGSPFRCMLDCYGNETPHYRAFREHAAKVGPLGPLLARARLNHRPSVTAVAPDMVQNGVGPEATQTIPAVHVSTLEPDRIDGRILIAVNMDRDRPQPLKIKVPDLGNDRCYDLVGLAEVPVSESGLFEPFTLRPGDGHPFLLCSPETFKEVKSLVTEAHTQQVLRVARLDLKKALAWKIDVSSEVDAAQALESDTKYRGCRDALAACRKILGRLETMMNIAAHGDDAMESPALDDAATKLLAASETYDQCAKDFYEGKKDGLLQRLKELRTTITALEPAVSKATGAKPGSWPFPERPWASSN